MPTITVRRFTAPLLLALALAALFITSGTRSAAAHDALAQAVPTADDTVTSALPAVTLTFSETPMSEFANALILRVTGPSGVSVTTGPPEADGTTLTAPVALREAGTHTVEWQSVSSDGHAISGAYTFTYAGPLPSAPTPVTPEDAPTSTATPAEAPTETATAFPSPPSSESDSGSNNAVPLIIGTTLVAALLLAVLLALRYFHLKRQRGDQTPSPTSPASDA